MYSLDRLFTSANHVSVLISDCPWISLIHQRKMNPFCDLRFACRKRQWINQIANAFDMQSDCEVFREIGRKGSIIDQGKRALVPRCVRVIQCTNCIAGAVIDASFLFADCHSAKIVTYCKITWRHDATQCRGILFARLIYLCRNVCAYTRFIYI